MRRIVLNQGEDFARTSFLDLSGRYRPRNHGSEFRMGDRAATYLWGLEWRKRHPRDRVIIMDDPYGKQAAIAAQIDAPWIFSEIAHEVWLTDYPGEVLPNPNKENMNQMYHTCLWRIWWWLRNNVTCDPNPKPKPEAMTRARELIAEHKIPEKYVVIQPLFDAPYNTYRNAPTSWWKKLIERTATRFPVVVLGKTENAQQLPLSGHNIFPLWTTNLSLQDSLALTKLSSTMVGGETGLPLWASLFKVPVVATWAYWGPVGNAKTCIDYRPIGFGKPVLYTPLNGDLNVAVGNIATALESA